MSTKPLLLRKELETLRGETKQMLVKAEKAKHRISAKLEALRGKIVSGEGTTGDRIMDYVIVVHGAINETAAKPYRKLDDELAGRKGELFLVVTRHLESMVKYAVAKNAMSPHGGFFDHGKYLETTRVMGRLKDERLILDFKNERVGLSTKKFLHLHTQGTILTTESNYWFFGLDSLDGRSRTISTGHTSGTELEILIGDTRVLGSYKNYNDYLFDNVREAWLILLRKAARLLGKDLPEVPEEREAHEEERREVLARLDQLRDKYRHNQSQENKEKLSTILTHAREIGLGGSPIVELVTSELSA